MRWLRRRVADAEIVELGYAVRTFHDRVTDLEQRIQRTEALVERRTELAQVLKARVNEMDKKVDRFERRLRQMQGAIGIGLLDEES